MVGTKLVAWRDRRCWASLDDMVLRGIECRCLSLEVGERWLLSSVWQCLRKMHGAS
jgi:hypothetical protein